MGKIMTVIPAYGRDYKSAKAAKADFATGRDFIAKNIMDRWDGLPCNIHELRTAGYTDVKIRYAKMCKVTIVKI